MAIRKKNEVKSLKEGGKGWTSTHPFFWSLVDHHVVLLPDDRWCIQPLHAFCPVFVKQRRQREMSVCLSIRHQTLSLNPLAQPPLSLSPLLLPFLRLLEKNLLGLVELVLFLSVTTHSILRLGVCVANSSKHRRTWGALFLNVFSFVWTIGPSENRENNKGHNYVKSQRGWENVHHWQRKERKGNEGAPSCQDCLQRLTSL